MRKVQEDHQRVTVKTAQEVISEEDKVSHSCLLWFLCLF